MGMKRKLSNGESEAANKHCKVKHVGNKISGTLLSGSEIVISASSKTDVCTKKSHIASLKKRTNWKSKHGTIYVSSTHRIKNKTSKVEHTNNSAKTDLTTNNSVKRKPGSCMKHKRKDKKATKPDKMEETVVKKSEGKRPDPIHLPKSSAEISANWKQLIKSDKSLRRKHHKKSHKEKHHRGQMKKENKESVSESVPDIWFDDVDEVLIDTLRPKPICSETKSMPSSKGEKSDGCIEKKAEKANPLVKPQSFEGLTKVLAMDCEMVGVGDGGKDSILARVSMVNQFGQCVYDKHVKPTERVTDYRTHVSGIRRKDIEKGENFADVQQEVSDMIKDRVLVGHALQNDFKVLFLSHPTKKIRDTVRYRPFVALFNGKRPSLKKLTEKVLGVAVQEGEHDSVQDAQAAMRLYTMYRKQWEKELKDKFKKVRKVKP